MNRHPRRWHRFRKAFSLIEILAVVAVIAILALIALPSFSNLSSSQFTSNLNQIRGTLDFARQVAAAKNTYSWVLLAPSTGGQQVNQVIMVVISSTDGTDPIAWGTYPTPIPNNQISVESPPMIMPQMNLLAARAVTVAGTPTSGIADLSSCTASVQMNVPGKGPMTFTRAIRFSTSTGARISNAAQTGVEFDLQRSSGAKLDTKNVAVVQVDTSTGLPTIYRP